jgi:hypothetical protein
MKVGINETKKVSGGTSTRDLILLLTGSFLSSTILTPSATLIVSINSLLVLLLLSTPMT